MRRSRSVIALVLSIASAATSCSRPASQLVVVVESDVPVTEIGCVDVTVQRLDEPERVTTRRFHVTADGEPQVAIPFSLGVVPPDGHASRRVEVRAEAFRLEGSACATAPLVSRIARTGFLPEQTLRLPLFLARACVGIECGADSTCDGGECVLVPDIDPGELAVAVPGMEIADAGPRLDAPSVTSPLEQVVPPEPTDGDRFDDAVALSDDGTTLAVGARDEDSSGIGVTDPLGRDELATDSGAAFVYARDGAGWSLQAFVKAPNADAGDAFGASVAISSDGNVLAIGAPHEDGGARGVGGPSEDDSTFDSGAAYLYRRSAGVWAFEAYVKAPNRAANDLFGVSLALSGDGSTLVVGAPAESSSAGGLDPATDDDLAAGAGAVYVYRHDGTRWALDAHVKAPTPGLGDQLGFAVAASESGDTVAIGARQEESSGALIDPPHDDLLPDSGAVYVLRRTAGAWAYEATVKAHVPGLEDLFGFSVALDLSGDVLIVGALHEDTGAGGVGPMPDEDAADSGAVYVFRRAGTAWSFESFLKLTSPASIDRAGYSVASTGAGARIAAATWPAAAAPTVGSFAHDGTAWSVGSLTELELPGPGGPRAPVHLALSDSGVLAIGAPDAVVGGIAAGAVEIHVGW